MKRVEAPEALEKWLNKQGLEGFPATTTKAAVMHFHGEEIPEILGRSLPVGLTAARTEFGCHVWFYLLKPSIPDGAERWKLKIGELSRRFEDIDIYVRPEVSFHLEFVSTADVKPRSFGRVLREGSQSAGVEFLGLLR